MSAAGEARGQPVRADTPGGNMLLPTRQWMVCKRPDRSEPEPPEWRREYAELTLLCKADRTAPIIGEVFKRGSRRRIHIPGLWIVDMAAYRATICLQGCHQLGSGPAADLKPTTRASTNQVSSREWECQYNRDSQRSPLLLVIFSRRISLITA